MRVGLIDSARTSSPIADILSRSLRDYAERMRFYLQKIFTCELTGKSNIDFFDALDSEERESARTQNAFPNSLKPRVLQSCQWRKQGGIFLSKRRY